MKSEIDSDSAWWGELPAIEKMPNRPKERPLDIHSIAVDADTFLMDPANGVLRTDERGRRYFAAFVEGASRELITYGCVVTGKLLRGDSAEELLPTLESFFHSDFGLFLNSPFDPDTTRGSAIEYWYLMDVNALAYATITLGMSGDSRTYELFRNSADSIYRMARDIDYDFNGQGYAFGEGKPYTKKDIFRQPDAVAGYSYLMLAAYETFGGHAYLDEAVKAMELYLAFDSNPWYEIPSGAMGALTAARLNDMGCSFDLDKALRFVFDDETGSMMTGRWGDSDVDGLMIGWRGSSRSEAISSVYSMESMVVLPYVLPVTRYDPRFARAIGKYALNALANIRLFYPEFLPEDHQSRPDLHPSIPYERLRREYEGKSPYGMGDAAGHRSVYGGGYALWWDAIAGPTDQDFIFRFDVTKTDFLDRGRTSNPTYLYYNPWSSEKHVTLDVGNEMSDIYELTSGTRLFCGISGEVRLRLPGEDAVVVTVLPSGENHSSSPNIETLVGERTDA